MPQYIMRSVTTLLELEAGDHIRAREMTVPARRWFFGSPSRAIPATTARHMLVVRPLSEVRVHVIRKTPEGVREESVTLDANDITVFEYECRFLGNEAIERARSCHGDEYDIVNSNSEHFVTSAKTGQAFSVEETTNIPQRRIVYDHQNIQSLNELNTGDHIRVRGSGGQLLGFFRGINRPRQYHRQQGRLYTHHMLVVRVVDPNRIRVIHKMDTGVVEEVDNFEPNEITVLHYECRYQREEAVARAREMIGQSYHVVSNNCEHFVTEARTGERSSGQVGMAVAGGLVGGAVGAPVGVVGGVVGGALAGGVAGVFLPLVGTAAGAVVGGVVGFLGGAGMGVARGGMGGLRQANRTQPPGHGDRQ